MQLCLNNIFTTPEPTFSLFAFGMFVE